MNDPSLALRQQIKLLIQQEVKHAEKTLNLPKHMTETLEIGLKKGAELALTITNKSAK